MRLFSLATVAAALLVAGCGSSSSSSTGSTSSSSNQPASQTQSGGSTGKATGATTVTIKNFAFTPATVHVGVGTKITFVNDDSVDHDVTATSGASFKSSLFGKGGHYVVTADKAGTIDYVCTVHPYMKAQIVVTG
jgi:plastocyanin